jgi:hypothetical protein
MYLNMEMLWQTWMTTLGAGLAILISVAGGFVLVGFLFGCCREMLTRKEEEARRNKAQEPEATYERPASAKGALSLVAETRRGAGLKRHG